MPTLVDIEGFEHQVKVANATATMNPKLWDTAADTGSLITFVTGRDGTGTAFRVDQDGATACRLLRNVTTAGTLFVVSFYIKWEVSPGSAVARALHMTADIVGFIGIDTDGTSVAQWAGGAKQNGPSLTDGAWHRIDARFNSSPATHTVDWQVDGSAQTQATGAGAAASNIVSFGFGSNTTANQTATFQIDDFVASATTGDYPMGTHNVFAVVPSDDNAASVYGTNAMEQGTGTDLSSSNEGWQYLDEWPPGSAGTANAADTVTLGASATASNFVDMEFQDAPAYAISTLWGVTGVVAHQSDGTLANNGTTRIVDSSGTTLTDIYSGDMSETSGHYTRRVITAPSGGWVVDATHFNGVRARVGLSTDISPQPEWLALMLQVATPDVAGIQTNQTIDATATLTAAITRQIAETVAATSTLIAALTRTITETVAAGVTGTVALTRRSTQFVAATVTGTVALTRRTTEAIATTVTGTVVLATQKVFVRAIAATVILTVALSRSIRETVAVAAPLVAVLTRRTGKLITATVTGTVAVRRRITKTIPISAAHTVVLATTKLKAVVISVGLRFIRKVGV